MTDERFNELKAFYFDGDITEKDMGQLHQAIGDCSRYRKRFQEESRLHVLMREAMSEDVELNTFFHDVVSKSNHESYPLFRILSAASAVIIISYILISIYISKTGLDGKIRMGTCMYISGSGIVQVERNARRFALLPDMPLQVGDRVICDSKMQVMLRLSDDSILSMEPNSSLTLVSVQPLVKLEHGEVLFEISERQEDSPAFEVLTNRSKVDVMGTVFTLEASDHTQLKVYEGSVNFTRHSDNASVQVNSEQMASTSTTTLAAEKNLSVSTLTQPVSVVSLLPTDDVTLELGKRITGREIKVEGKRRKAYLRFEVPELETIHSAKLRLTQEIDPGSGTLRFFNGNHSDWTENNLTKSKAPVPVGKAVLRTGVVQRHEVIEVEVSKLISEAGAAITIIISLDEIKGQDIWFGSKESSNPPQLILTYSTHVPESLIQLHKD